MGVSGSALENKENYAQNLLDLTYIETCAHTYVHLRTAKILTSNMTVFKTGWCMKFQNITTRLSHLALYNLISTQDLPEQWARIQQGWWLENVRSVRKRTHPPPMLLYTLGASHFLLSHAYQSTIVKMRSPCKNPRGLQLTLVALEAHCLLLPAGGAMLWFHYLYHPTRRLRKTGDLENQLKRDSHNSRARVLAQRVVLSR